MERKRLGVVVDGSFTAGLTVRLDPGCSTEDLQIGSFMVVQGREYTYFCMLADLQLRTSDARLIAKPPQGFTPFVSRVLSGSATYAMAVVKPMLMMPTVDVVDPSRQLAGDTPEERGVMSVRTIPMHYAELVEATEMDFATVFGSADKANHFVIGQPLTMDLPICLDLARFMERSSGLFGQTGTGKSFTALLILAGIIQHDVGSTLIFDAHNEYAYGKESEAKQWVRGLKSLFGSKVLVYSLDEAQANKSGRPADGILKIGMNQIEPEDVILMSQELGLTAKAGTMIGLLKDRYNAAWLTRLIEMGPEELSEFCEQSGAHVGSVQALQRDLKKLARKEYVRPEMDSNLLDEIIQALKDGKHVILHFGKHSTMMDYMLVSNLVTRRVRAAWEAWTEQYERTKESRDRPRPLMITVEEAHKFLNPEIASQTIFGTIAREMRKFHVTLMVIDQRPSGIDSEVLSQLGTRISGKLADERDIEAVLTGVSDRSALRNALASLKLRQEVLVVGHAVPMPIQVRPRNYDEAFWKEVSVSSGSLPVDEKLEQEKRELFGA
ncbi:MAG: ATP-binding protein [Chloroflexi bacterium]|nr:ATP-binding protein [Chloroflexota bacterium]